MNVLSIESSCDETACAIVKDGREILSNVVVSQIDIFKAYGGVIPEVAARSHLEAILPVVHKALDDAFPSIPESDQWKNIDVISATHTPGLLGSLLIGTLTARTLAILHNKPFYSIHHLKSHIYSTWLNTKKANNATKAMGEARCATRKNMAANPATKTSFSQVEYRKVPGADLPEKDTFVHDMSYPILESCTPSFPLLALVISGGHTQIIKMSKHNDFKIIGTTRDDAVGECFDKVAKILGLPYPGGPAISNAALGHITLQDGVTFETTPGDRHKYHFPHPKLTNPPRQKTTSTTPSLDFSFSGLKTAVLRELQSTLDVPISFPSHDLPKKIRHQKDPARLIADFAASFEQTTIDILLENLHNALNIYPDTKSIIIAGGVSANSLLRKQSIEAFDGKNIFTAFSRDSSITLSNKSHFKEEAIKDFSGYCTAYERAIAPSALDDWPNGRDSEKSLNCFFPDKTFSGDNAAMVASATYYEINSGTKPSDPYSLTLLPRSPIS